MERRETETSRVTTFFSVSRLSLSQTAMLLHQASALLNVTYHGLIKHFSLTQKGLERVCCCSVHRQNTVLAAATHDNYMLCRSKEENISYFFFFISFSGRAVSSQRALKLNGRKRCLGSLICSIRD